MGRTGSSRGFTLIELMITVVIIAVLAMVAMPAFRDQIRKSRRADAIANLNQISQAQERWRSNCSSFVTTTASMTAAAGTSCGGGLALPGTSSYYSYAVAPVTGVASSIAYAATATATGAQATDAKCATLTLAASGGQFTFTSTGTATANQCWNR